MTNHAERLRHMAAGWLQSAEATEKYGHPREKERDIAHYRAQPALDWLAQQRAEAAAEENDRWADDWWGRKGDCTASDFTARAAALRAGATGGADA